MFTAAAKNCSHGLIGVVVDTYSRSSETTLTRRSTDKLKKNWIEKWNSKKKNLAKKAAVSPRVTSWRGQNASIFTGLK